jgi:predicted ATPase/DNA-binding winged helix-turn-helix (wHTH) protein
MDSVSEPAAGVAFGRFWVLPHRRELLADGQPVKLGGRAFDVLMALIEARGAVLSKDALMTRVWPDRIVEENNLQAQIVMLRKAFGAERDLIRTIAGRGYQFTSEVRTVSASPDTRATAGMPQATPAASRLPTNLPEPVSELIGRDVELDEILDLSSSHRLVTLTGAGGIGKTRLGFEVARRLLPNFVDGIWTIELAPLSDPELVPVAVATALGLELASGTATPLSVATALGSKQLLLVLDNCEHVVEAAARMAEALLRVNPAARVIATSREPLRADGEWVYPVPPLAVPAEGSPDGEDPLRYGAVRLFVERALAAAPHFSPDARVLAAIAGICRRLDGIPLAIELAAARVATLGIEGLAAGLDDRFRLLAGGHRTAMPRHQTLRAALDWSYELLTEPERVVLRRLAVFAGGFTLPAASTVVADDEIAASEVVDGVANLVAKSLVTVERAGMAGRWRLLETIRAYALGKLAESGEAETAARRHATFFRDLFSPAGSPIMAGVEDMAHYAQEIDNVRAALDWAFSSAGDSDSGIVLTAAYVPVWLNFASMVECRERTERALDSLEAGSNFGARLRMRLQIPLGVALLHSSGLVERTEAVLAEALETAESLDDVAAQLRALWAMWSYRFNIGDNGAALPLAERFSRVAHRAGDAADVLVGDRLMGSTMHHSGNQQLAQRHLQRVVDRYVAPSDQRHTIWFVHDQRLMARLVLARVLALQGSMGKAIQNAQASLQAAQTADHKLSVCYALGEAVCPIALLTGDLATAARSVAMLNDLVAEHSVTVVSVGPCLEGELLIKRGEFAAGSSVLRTALDRYPTTGFKRRYSWFLGVLAGGLASAQRLTAAFAAIEEALAQSDRNGQHWCVAELRRVKGELLLQRAGENSTLAAEDCFRAALDVAREQGALFWELRAALSLAHLRIRQDRQNAARAILAPVYGRFTEGFETADLKAAKALLDDLS